MCASTVDEAAHIVGSLTVTHIDGQRVGILGKQRGAGMRRHGEACADANPKERRYISEASHQMAAHTRA